MEHYHPHAKGENKIEITFPLGRCSLSLTYMVECSVCLIRVAAHMGSEGYLLFGFSLWAARVSRTNSSLMPGCLGREIARCALWGLLGSRRDTCLYVSLFSPKCIETVGMTIRFDCVCFVFICRGYKLVLFGLYININSTSSARKKNIDTRSFKR